MDSIFTNPFTGFLVILGVAVIARLLPPMEGTALKVIVSALYAGYYFATGSMLGVVAWLGFAVFYFYYYRRNER